MQKLSRNAAYVLLLALVAIYAAAALAAVAVLFVAAIALDAVFAGWTRDRTQTLNRNSLMEGPDLARR